MERENEEEHAREEESLNISFLNEKELGSGEGQNMTNGRNRPGSRNGLGRGSEQDNLSPTSIQARGELIIR